jgi:hypothetical protein
VPSPTWRRDALKPTASRKVHTRRSIVRSQPNPVTTTHPQLAACDPYVKLGSLCPCDYGKVSAATDRHSSAVSGPRGTALYIIANFA